MDNLPIPLLDSIKSKITLPSFKYRQIQKSYLSGRYRNFGAMTDLAKDLRATLDQHFSLYSVTLDKIVESSDSSKARLKLSDGKTIETVLMKYRDWNTVCVSSQVGCPLGCTFCATGRMGFFRNLTVSEIIDQIIFWKKDFTVDRIVFMGMGEPFLNWDNVLLALNIINSPDGLGIGARKISISTAGIIPGINKLAQLNKEYNLAISLHASNQFERETIMPIARQYDYDDLISAATEYANLTHRQVFFEYAPINNVNDSSESIAQLIRIIHSHPLFYLNLIPLNLVAGGCQPSHRLESIQLQLEQAHVNFSFRRSIGQDINSACGQLITHE